MTATTDLLSVDEAQSQILQRTDPLPTEMCRLIEALGRVVAREVVSDVAIPPFANSAMDGFAVRSGDTTANRGSARLKVVREVQAGALDPGAIGRGEAARIMTGAPLPEGADSVVPFEETETGEGWVDVPSSVRSGACVRPRGLDINPGDVILERGVLLGAPQLALCASVGCNVLEVYRRPVVVILTTGDELVEPGAPLRPGQIYNSNAYGLAAAVEQAGGVPKLLQPQRDDPVALRETLQGIEGADLILTSGGVSVGDFDYVKEVIAGTGRVDFWRIRMRPGKPLMLGSISPRGGSGETMILGLPGNPTSTMVTFYVFARPVILKMMGATDPVPAPLRATTRDRLDNQGGRETFFRVRIAVKDGELIACLSGGQDSSMLLPLARANALARVPAEVTTVEAGGWVDVYPLGAWTG